MSFQLIYRNKEQHYVFTPEMKFMDISGVPVGHTPSQHASRLLFRGTICRTMEDYPVDSRSIHTAQIYFDHLYLPRWYPFIADLTMETLFVSDLDDNAIDLLKTNGWRRAFVKDWIKSAAFPDLNATVWPQSSMEAIKERLQRVSRPPGFCLRAFVEPERLSDETRFWVINDNIYSSVTEPFAIVKEAVKRLKPLAGLFYTVDATPEMVIEINPGESSDRGAKNTLQDFAEWIRSEFC